MFLRKLRLSPEARLEVLTRNKDRYINFWYVRDGR
jgi:hypothetical protein